MRFSGRSAKVGSTWDGWKGEVALVHVPGAGRRGVTVYEPHTCAAKFPPNKEVLLLH